MSHRSINRSIYYERNIKYITDITECVKALVSSPFRSHRRKGLAFRELIKKEIERNE